MPVGWWRARRAEFSLSLLLYAINPTTRTHENFSSHGKVGDCQQSIVSVQAKIKLTLKCVRLVFGPL